MSSPFSIIQAKIDTPPTLRDEKQPVHTPSEAPISGSTGKQNTPKPDPLPQNHVTLPPHLVVSESKTASTGFNIPLQDYSNRVIVWSSAIVEFLKLVRDSFSPPSKDPQVIYIRALEILNEAIARVDFEKYHPDTCGNFTAARTDVQIRLIRLLTKGGVHDPQ